MDPCEVARQLVPLFKTIELALTRPSQLQHILPGSKTICALYIDGQEESTSDKINRFKNRDTFLILNLGPDTRDYLRERIAFS
jgi:hypothetical protein